MEVVQARLPLAPNRIPRPGLVIVDRGLEDYDATYKEQRAWVQRLKEGGDFDRLFFVEHPEVYTYGRRTSANELEGVNAVGIERGGQVTYHNPGQLVSYPVLKLQEDERDLHAYLRRLEDVLIAVLDEFGLPGERRAGATGVWVSGRGKKIASIGVAVSSWVTYHGTALNVCNNLLGFSRIRPCGFDAQVMTSLSQELGDRAPSMAEAKDAYTRHFCRIFDRLLAI